MAKTIEELKKEANQVKNETQSGANTAQRIGTLFLDIIEKIEELDKNSEQQESSIGLTSSFL